MIAPPDLRLLLGFLIPDTVSASVSAHRLSEWRAARRLARCWIRTKGIHDCSHDPSRAVEESPDDTYWIRSDSNEFLSVSDIGDESEHADLFVVYLVGDATSFRVFDVSFPKVRGPLLL